MFGYFIIHCSVFWDRIEAMLTRDRGLGFGVLGLGFEAWGLGVRDLGLGIEG